MAYYPTPEEEYELMYGEELELMNELDGKCWKLFKNTKINNFFIL